MSFLPYTAEGLNALFGTLDNKVIIDKFITISGNPGGTDCNQSIAKGKGWRVVATN